jgi:hypothetical protein
MIVGAEIPASGSSGAGVTEGLGVAVPRGVGVGVPQVQSASAVH